MKKGEYTMTMKNLDPKAARLRELLALIDELNAEADAIRDEFKAAMIDSGDETISGTGWKATWKTVTSSRIDTTALKKALPDIAERFTKTSTTCRFCFT